MNLEDAIKQIVKEQLGKKSLKEGKTADPIVDSSASALSHNLVNALENDQVLMNNAFEMVMGMQPENEMLTLARYEDLDTTAELVVQAIYRNAEVHDALHHMARTLLRSLMEEMQG